MGALRIEFTPDKLRKEITYSVGTVNLSGRRTHIMGHEKRFRLRSAIGRGPDLVQGLSISARHHQLRGMAVLPFSAEPAHGRGAAGRTGDRAHVRNGAVLGDEVRSGDR